MTSSSAPMIVQLRPNLWIHATMHTATLLRDGIPSRAGSAASPAVTRRLLDGALAAVWNPRIRARRASPPLTPTRWLWRLVGYYHLTHSTTDLLTIASATFARNGQPSLARWARERAREEAHHDELARRDLQAMGVDPSLAIARLRPHPAQALVDWFRSAAVATDPIACVGYAYVVERLAMGTTAEDIAAVDRIVPADVRATRCMRVHSAAGSDADHVADTVAVVAALPVDQRAAVARSVYEAALVCTHCPADGGPSDAWIRSRLDD